MSIDRRTISVWICASTVLMAACARAPRARTSAATETEAGRGLLPAPVSLERSAGAFPIGPGIVIVAPADTTAIRIARQIAEMIRRATGVLPGILSSAEGAASGRIVLSLDTASGGSAGDEAYDLTIGPTEVTLKASGTGRPLLRRADDPPAAAVLGRVRSAHLRASRAPVSLPAAPHRRSSPLRVARRDARRRAPFLRRRRREALHRSAGAATRLTGCTCISPTTRAGASRSRSWPDLTAQGGSREVGGGAGGFYTQEQYADLVAYAAERFITIVPEIDMPGHTNAALSSYAELNCNGTRAGALHGHRGRLQRAVRRRRTSPTGSSTMSSGRSRR